MVESDHLDHLVTEINEKLVVPLPGFQAQLLIQGKWHCIGYNNFWIMFIWPLGGLAHKSQITVIGKLGHLTEEKLKPIHVHYGGDMAID